MKHIQVNLPLLARKTSILQMGIFVDNWKNGQVFVPWHKVAASRLSIWTLSGLTLTRRTPMDP